MGVIYPKLRYYYIGCLTGLQNKYNSLNFSPHGVLS